MNQKFQQQKEKQLEMKDNSSIGEWDEEIKKLCEKINRKKEYYTTSSCSGRIVLIKQAEKKQGGLFLFRTHKKINFKQLKNELLKAIKTNKTDLVYFRQEPCILHVACASLAGAQNLLDSAKLAGWKNSGIMASSSRIVLEMRSTEFIQMPIINLGKMLVDDKFLKLLVKEANRKLERTFSKIKKLEKLLL
ncbi:MAG: hypothetical protein KKB21_00515 [Nanoarchaeota archaeon]|nr:hypothetical protein [Nanoarchaeota archaeon]MBU4086038.1 hypothetical protein [Nanoarchaeota archaeon]